MPSTIYLNQSEARILAKALNNARLSSFSPSERAMLPALGRRLSGFMADGQSAQPRGPSKKPIGFAKVREGISTPQQLIETIPPGFSSVVNTPQCIPLPNMLSSEQLEAVYATLRGI